MTDDTPVSELEGRRLDAAVAEEVMGDDLEELPVHEWGPVDAHRQEAVGSAYRCTRCGHVPGWQSLEEIKGTGPCKPSLRSYSSLWGLAEKVWGEALGPGWELDQVHENEWRCCNGRYQYGEPKKPRVLADTAPEAIARAALRAVRDE